MTSIDDLTRRWIFNEADAKAAAAAARFNINRAAWTLWWIGRYCRLYEGSHAGEPLVLRGAWSMGLDSSQDPWDKGGKKWAVQRIRDQMDCQDAGEPTDWQLPVTARLFGWVMYSERWNAEIRRFTKGSMFIPKKSKKSPTLAATGLYLLAGDGEPGANVYFCAADGNQAKDIAGRHACQMLKASKELSASCHLDNAKMKIEYKPTNSLLQPLASGNIRTQKAREGLNGTALADEVHVVTRDFMGRIVRMGISRKEPFILDYSTVGDDLETYGHDQYVYGHKVNKTGSDLHFFFQSYEAPQGLSMTELDANFEKYVTMANPSLGHTIDMDEARQDYKTSKESQENLQKFCQYRLNIWSRTATPWIALDDWTKGGTEAARPIQEVCWGALEIGYVDEPSAFTLVWPNDHYAIDEAIAAKKPLLELLGALDQPVHSMTWYWLPRGAVDRLGDTLPYRAWEAAELAKIQENGVVDLNGIVADISAIINAYDVQAIGFAPWKSATVMNRLREQDGYPEERCWEFQERSPAAWSFPCALFERLILARRLEHNTNAILDWELGHATIKTDRTGGVSLVKPERGDPKTVNGIASLIMALDAMAKAPRFYRSELVMIGMDYQKEHKEAAQPEKNWVTKRGMKIREYWEENGRLPTPGQIAEMVEQG